MKRFLIVCGFLVSRFAHGQSDSLDKKPAVKLKNEASVILYSGYKPPAFSYNNGSDYILFGLQYKLVINKIHSVRASCEMPLIISVYNKNDYVPPGSAPEPFEHVEKYSLGYQFTYNKHVVIKPYGFVDCFHENVNAFAVLHRQILKVGSSYDSSNVIDQHAQFSGLSLGGGVKFASSKYLFISFEGSFGIGFYRQKGTITNTITYNDKTTHYQITKPAQPLPAGGHAFCINGLRVNVGFLF